MFFTNTLAYIDPATTSYLIQIVAGVVIAGGAAIGIFWKKITMAFTKKKYEILEKNLEKQAQKNEQSTKVEK